MWKVKNNTLIKWPVGDIFSSNGGKPSSSLSCYTELCARSHFSQTSQFRVDFSSVQDGIYALGKAHMRSNPSLRSFPSVVFETVPMRVWLTMALSRPFKEDLGRVSWGTLSAFPSQRLCRVVSACLAFVWTARAHIKDPMPTFPHEVA